MRILLLKYNKVTNESLGVLVQSLDKHQIVWGDLAELGKDKRDLLPYQVVTRYLDAFEPLDAVVIGDVFWTTGHNICKWCENNKRARVKCVFLQHGQWIYVENKRKLRRYPTHTAMFGDDTANECRGWSYGQSSKVIVTGSPRYDPYARCGDGDYVFFSPPVIQELIHEQTGPMREPFYRALLYIAGFDRETRVLLQPHYREARVDLLYRMFKDAEFVHPKDKTLDLVAGSNKVVASRNSTVVLDAIVCGKPTVFTEFPNCDSAYFFRGTFGKFGLESDDRKHFMENILSDYHVPEKDYEELARRHIRLGNASKRIVQILESG